MRISRIYVDPAETALVPNAEVELAERNSHYLKNVLRLKKGAAIALFDGCGNEYAAHIAGIGRRDVTVAIQGGQYFAPAEGSLDIFLAIAICKPERMDWAVQKATELGVCTIQPLISEFVDIRLSEERLQKKLKHL